MSYEVKIGLILLTFVIIGKIILNAYNAGVFDHIYVKLYNFINSQINRSKKKDI